MSLNEADEGACLVALHSLQQLVFGRHGQGGAHHCREGRVKGVNLGVMGIHRMYYLYYHLLCMF